MAYHGGLHVPISAEREIPTTTITTLGRAIDNDMDGAVS
jgi:hypothetical protein